MARANLQPRSVTHRTRLRFNPLLLTTAFLATSPCVWAAGTPAGTVIDNAARVDFDIGGTNITVNSNTVSIVVDERIDVVTTLSSPQILVSAGDLDRGLLFAVTNTGNGSEVVNLAIDSNLAGDDFNPIPLCRPSISTRIRAATSVSAISPMRREAMIRFSHLTRLSTLFWLMAFRELLSMAR